MNFIKNIFEGTVGDFEHRQFKRFSKGEFKDRAIMEITVGSKIKIKTSFEYAEGFVRLLAEKITTKVNVTGGIITTAKDFEQVTGIPIDKTKQFQGVRTYMINTDLSKDDILNAMNKFSDAVYCLTFTNDYGSLKTKVKSPKSAKPGKGDEDAKADYCTFTTSDKNLLRDFVFDVHDSFKSCKINHTFIINEIIVPKEYQNDFALARIHAKKKGKIVRKLDLDGKEIINEFDFEA
ncbi:hypothetical protein J4216_01880 [Candidatus Woesearchaeota archaeon]|nr:hypothetical protein [Candidatus Woesearchaeota archaeon]